MNAMVETERLFSGVGGTHRRHGIGLIARNVYLLCYLPMSLVPSAMLMFAWNTYHATAWSGVSIEAAIVLAASLWFAELTVVPLLVAAVHVIGGAPDARSAHHDVEFLEAFAPPALMLMPLFLLVPKLFVWGVAGSVIAVGMMLFLGGYAITDPQDSDSRGLSWLVVDLGFMAWAAIMLTVILI